jgi:hypothetical protein
MGEVVPIQDGPLPQRRAKAMIQRLWNEGMVTWRDHFEQELLNDGLQMTDVEYGIRYGHVIDHSRPRNNWRYTLEVTLLDGRRAAFVAEISGMLVMITAFIVKPKLPRR